MIRTSIARTAIAAAALVALTAPGLSQTRQPTAQESKIVADCFAQKGGTPKDDQCIGVFAARCAKKPESQGGLARADCYRIEQAVWDKLLNQTYKELQGDLDEEQKTKLRDMQRAWIASRDATCEFYHVKIQGSMAVPMSANCFLTETAKRALFLKTMMGL